jgi:hypothetical protein
MEPKKITQAEYLWGWYVFEVVLYVHVFAASSITFVAKNFFYTACVSGVSDILSRRTEHRRSLARVDSYHRTGEISMYDLNIKPGGVDPGRDSADHYKLLSSMMSLICLYGMDR